MDNKPVYAIAVFNDTIKGNVKFTEDLENNVVSIDLNISGLKPNSNHGFHVHEAGDLTDKCICVPIVLLNLKTSCNSLRPLLLKIFLNSCIAFKNCDSLTHT